MAFLNEETDTYEDDWEAQGATYEQTLMAFKNNSNFKPDLYYKHNYSKKRKKKKRRHKAKFKRKRKDNVKKIQQSFGKPILHDVNTENDDKLTMDRLKRMNEYQDSGQDSDSSIGSSPASLTSNGSGKGSISSIKSKIEGVPINEWFSSRLYAIKDIFMLAWPIFLTSELLALLYFINLLYIGNRYNSADKLAGASLACSLINIVGQSFIIGVSSSLDTLCGQSFGAALYKMCGTFLYRMIAIIHILIIIIGVIFYYSHQLLQLLGQPKNVIIWSSKFMQIFIFALWPLSIWYCLRRFLQSQGKVKMIFPSVIFALLGQFGGLFLLDIHLNIGFISTAYSLVIAYWMQFIVLIVLIFITRFKDSNHFKQTCIPCITFSELFKGWFKIISLSIPAVAMLCSEWWAFELQTIFAGWVGDDNLAGFALSLNYLTMTIKVPLSISWANGIVIANKLGKMRPDDASAAWDASLILSTFTTGIVSLLTYFLRSTISMAYAPQKEHEDIREIMEDCLIILAIYMMIDQIQRCGQGAIRGMGLQKFGAYSNVFTYYAIGIPLGLYLCFKQKFHVKGLWYGMCIASFASSLVFIVIRFKINWREQVKKAFQRIQDKEKKLKAFGEEYGNNNDSNIVNNNDNDYRQHSEHKSSLEDNQHTVNGIGYVEFGDDEDNHTLTTPRNDTPRNDNI